MALCAHRDFPHIVKRTICTLRLWSKRRKIASEMATRLFPARWTPVIGGAKSSRTTINAKHSQHVARILPNALSHMWFIMTFTCSTRRHVPTALLIVRIVSFGSRCSVIVNFQIKKPQKGDRLPLQILYLPFQSSTTELHRHWVINAILALNHWLIVATGIPSLNHLCDHSNRQSKSRDSCRTIEIPVVSHSNLNFSFISFAINWIYGAFCRLPLNLNDTKWCSCNKYTNFSAVIIIRASNGI